MGKGANMSGRTSKTAAGGGGETPSKAGSKRRSELLGEIRSGSAYPLEVFRQKTGFGTWAIRQMRRAGLRIHRRSNRCFVIGADFLKFLTEQADASP